MLNPDPKDVSLYMELEKRYKARFLKEGMADYALFPREFDDLDDFVLKNKLLQQALDENKTLFDLDYVMNLHRERVEQQLEDNINETIRRSK